ncbi:gas vesicle protein GvpG [Actinorugispora endophytica]|uniref:Gas vesicle protein GvpG n=1 Tax=Actinorugispora endophytica TaxID=1605990 RepID=A0A4R6V589_9ACTN|nr:gas vesicle protein GvpG [Actinorugispora endophytica]TDQ55383.1 gas vesicle protein GvpG [Actinorugispora endophytica]
MGLVGMILTAPFAPLRAVPWVARQVLDAAEREFYDPAVIRAELAELWARYDEGEIDEAGFDRAEDELLARLEEAEAIRGGPPD